MAMARGRTLDSHLVPAAQRPNAMVAATRVFIGMAILASVMVASALILNLALTGDDHCDGGSEPRIAGGDPSAAHETLRCLPVD